MKKESNIYSIGITPTDKNCPAGEKTGGMYLKQGKIPVLSCEGACIRGEISRLAAHMVAKEEPYRRGCNGELLTVPGSALTQWITSAEKIVLIDGCFLHCYGRILENLLGKEKLAIFDALSYYRKYTEHFDIDEVPEVQRRETAKMVADAVLAKLQRTNSRSTKTCAETACEGSASAASASAKGTGCGS
ncbi:MAG: hypothetical protein HZA10_09250 [Nitrospirae bacterium]|nr:hypothetical protein [Nitrospirota bacterium]